MRLVALLVSLAAAGAAGYTVHRELAEVFGDRIPLIGGVGVFVIVFPLLFFPLLRPLADLAHDRLAALGNRLRHKQVGTGLSDVPERMMLEETTPRLVRCGMCGRPGGPVCDACHEKLARR